MTDAYEDLMNPHEEHYAPKGAALEVRKDVSSAQNKQAHSHPECEQLGKHPGTAEQRRKEFRAWLLHRARHSSGSVQKAAERAAAEERRLKRFERLQERLAAAEANRAACLAQLQRRAAATSQRREGAAERAAAAAAERISTAAERLEAELAAAKSRRLALREAELERLRTEHELVLNRLVSSQERAAAGAEHQRSRLEARLHCAASERAARLAKRAARAASKVERARALGAQAREMQQQEAESRRQALERKLETARRRREERRSQLSGGAAAATTAARTTTAISTSPSVTSSTSKSSQSNLLLSDSQSLSPPQSQSESRSSSPIHSPQHDPDAVRTAAAAAAADGLTGSSSLAGDLTSSLRPGMGRGKSSGGADAVHPPEAENLVTSSSSGGEVAQLWAEAAEAEATSSRLEGLRRSLSSRRLQQVWREFLQSNRTTRTLAEVFVAQGITNVRLPGPTVGGAAVAGEDATVRAAGAVDVPRRLGTAAAEPAAVIIGVGGGGGGGGGGGAALGRGPIGDRSKEDEGGDGFDLFASALRSPATLKATQALTRRLEQRLAARQAAPSRSSNSNTKGHGYSHSSSSHSSSVVKSGGYSFSHSHHHHHSQGPNLGPHSPSSQSHQTPTATSVSLLLRRLYPNAPRTAPLERYPPRVLLCAFMIVRYPEVVFSGSGPRETALAAAARDLVDRLEALLERIIVVRAEPPPAAAVAAEPSGPLAPSPPDYAAAASPVARGMQELMQRQRATAAAAVLGGGGGFGLTLPSAPPSSASPSSSWSSPYMTIGSRLVQFDDAWLRYLDQFVAWKGADAASLEAELVRCAAALEASMLRKCRGDPTSERVRRSSDLQAVIAQVAHDQALLRERVAKLGGEAGLGRLELALEAARRAVAAEVRERGASGSRSPSPSASPSATVSEYDTTEAESPSRPSPRRGPLGTASATHGRNPAAAAPASATSLALSRQVTPPPPLTLTLDVPPPTAAAAVAGASAPIPTPVPQRRGYRHPKPPEVAADASADGSGAGAAGAAADVAPFPLSTSPRSPGSLRATLLGSDSGGGALNGGGGGAVHAVPPLDTALISNAAMVHEMLLGGSTGSYRLPTSEAEAAWDRAVAAVSQDVGGLAVLLPGPGDSLAEGSVAWEELQYMSQEQLIRALRSRTAAIAECAFWDNVIATLAVVLQPAAAVAATPGFAASRLAAVLAPLLSEVAFDMASVVNSPQQASALRADFNEGVIRSRIEGGDKAAVQAVPAVQRALGILERLAGLLVAAGAPIREAAALAAHDTMRQRLSMALAEYGQQLSQQPPQPPQPPKLAGSSSSGVSSSDGGGGDDDGNKEAAAAPLLPLAAALGRSLRLLAAQVKLLKVDAANSRLQALAASLQGDGGVAYLRSKFATIFRLEAAAAAAAAAATAEVAATAETTRPAAVASSTPLRLLQGGGDLWQSLPRTATWIRRSRAAAAGIGDYIRAQGVDLAAAVAAAAAGGGGAPFSLRAGLRPSPGGGGGSGSAATAAATAVRPPSVPPVVPVGPDGGGGSGAAAAWRWTVRCGLVGLVSSDSPAVGPSLAETLLWDGERLHAAQNQFQQLVVVTAGMLLVTQLRSAAAAAVAPAGAAAGLSAPTAAAAAGGFWDPATRAAAARRLLVVVADPGMRLPELTSELASLAGLGGDAAAELRVRGAFMSLVKPTSAAFRSISNALAAALLLHITLGNGGGGGGGGGGLPGSLGSATAANSGGGGGGTVGTSGVAAAAAGALLGRVGAAGLAADVASLGGQLLALCAVNEAVHGDLYEAMYGQILQEEEVAMAVTPSGGSQPQQQRPQVKASTAGATAEEGEEEEEVKKLAEGDEI